MRLNGRAKRYRLIDCALFALMLIVFETVAVRAASSWFPQEAYVISVVPAVTAIVLMRWGPWAAVHAVLGGVVFCMASGGTAQQFAVYCAGNLFSLLAWFLIRRLGAEEIRRSTGKSPMMNRPIASEAATSSRTSRNIHQSEPRMGY